MLQIMNSDSHIEGPEHIFSHRATAREGKPMTDDRAFIRAILAEPGNIGLRLVYADWLEEFGSAASRDRAEYIRVECKMDGLPPKDKRRRRLEERLKKLRETVGDDWWRELDWSSVDYCGAFEYRCPQRWDTLAPTEDSTVRHCPECREDVHYCETMGEALHLAEAGKCVAIDSRRDRIPLEVIRPRPDEGVMLGRLIGPQPKPQRRVPLSQRGQPAEAK
jgi:uncharacterized protein (TIGR02996 family)